MNITNQDLRAAVGAGMISEAQAASLSNLAQARLGAVQATAEIDEPFELFKGFNEIFIVVGLSILYAGWMGITGLSIWANDVGNGLYAALYGVVTIAVIALLARYFTLTRRMVAPSILLAVFTGLASLQLGYGLSNMLDMGDGMAASLIAAIVFVVQLAFWALFRVPFSMLILGLSAFFLVSSFFVAGNNGFPDFEDVFLLSGQGPFSIITFVLGLIGFAIAMRFDMSDPHRVTRRSANGFWLHVIAAPAIVNTVALTLFTMDTIAAHVILFIFLMLMAVVALVINRRSFLISGVGYVVALSVGLFDDGSAAGFAILAVGLVLVILGAGWEKFRATTLDGLPNFPGKDRLPPWGLNNGVSE